MDLAILNFQAAITDVTNLSQEPSTKKNKNQRQTFIIVKMEVAVGESYNTCSFDYGVSKYVEFSIRILKTENDTKEREARVGTKGDGP